ncbi:MAG: glycosyltransferase family 9 protein [Deltaproteobacteria bacterium]|nr:glycosyltransferase family 9 protein [Deltaproteobacteria bacterium]
MTNRPPRYLIVLLGSIGDVVRAIPLATRIKKHVPGVQLSWAIEPKSRGILDGHDAIDELIVFERSKGLPEFVRFLHTLRSKQFDVVLDLQRHFKSGITSLSTRAPRRIGFHRRNAKEFNWLFNSERIASFSDSLPKIAHYQKFGDLLGLPAASLLDFGSMYSPGDLDRARALIADRFASTGRPKAGIIVGSSWPSKDWPEERIVELAQRLSPTHDSVLIGGPAERERAEAIAAREPKTTVSLAGETSLRELAALLSLCHVVVGCDSGPMHIAAAVGTPVISLWGPTSPIRSGPYKNESLVLQSSIGCAPCNRRTCPGLEKLCMFDIPVDAVLAQLSVITHSRESRP